MIVAAVLGTQAICFLADEFVFHYRRGLPKWERIGHPIDTASIVLCLSVVAWSDPTPQMIRLYIGLCVFSSLLVTKDEWVHARACEPMEHWLHAMLFLLHPTALAVIGWQWVLGSLPRGLVLGQLGLVSAFGLYQVIYWNVWRER